jgi:hypothetical protein
MYGSPVAAADLLRVEICPDADHSADQGPGILQHEQRERRWPPILSPASRQTSAGLRSALGARQVDGPRQSDQQALKHS